jgi:hypothetical protein
MGKSKRKEKKRKEKKRKEKKRKEKKRKEKKRNTDKIIKFIEILVLNFSVSGVRFDDSEVKCNDNQFQCLHLNLNQVI